MPCGFARVLTTCDKPIFMCSKGCGVCRSGGEYARFRHISAGYRIVWLCDKLDGFPDLER